MIEMPEELNTISEALCALRDHYNEQGKVFMVGLYYKDDVDSDRLWFNLLSTSARDHDYLNATSSWTHRAVDWISENNN